MTFGYAFLTYLCTFVVYAVYEYAKILGLNNEILDISPPERIFKPIKLKPFFSWFIYEYDHRIGSPLLVVCLQFLVLPIIGMWLIGLFWFAFEFISGSFRDGFEMWEKINTISLLAYFVALAITTLTRLTVLIYCSCKKYPHAREYCWGEKIDWAEVRKHRKIRKEFKDIKWQCALQADLKKNCTKKYKGVVFVYQNDLNKLEAMISKKYPKAEIERTNNENKKSTWRVYYKEITLFEAPIRKK